jgi:release factor glutamine methyltransferase
LDFYRILSEKAKDILKPEGRLYCEIGYGQGETAKELLATQGWRDIRVLSDLAGRPRVCVCRV